MNGTTDARLETLRTLFPDIPKDDLAAASERFGRYIQLAIDTARRLDHANVPLLTDSPNGANVNAGQVDPRRTFTNTG